MKISETAKEIAWFWEWGARDSYIVPLTDKARIVSLVNQLAQCINALGQQLPVVVPSRGADVMVPMRLGELYRGENCTLVRVEAVNVNMVKMPSDVVYVPIVWFRDLTDNSGEWQCRTVEEFARDYILVPSWETVP